MGLRTNLTIPQTFIHVNAFNKLISNLRTSIKQEIIVSQILQSTASKMHKESAILHVKDICKITLIVIDFNFRHEERFIIQPLKRIIDEIGVTQFVYTDLSSFINKLRDLLNAEEKLEKTYTQTHTQLSFDFFESWNMPTYKQDDYKI